ncbi:MAG: iron dependent repressor, metal binding and dimerization domain protein [Bacillota bacterium]
MLTYTMEDYVETIYRLQTRRGYACVTDIAGCLGVKPPSVSRMLGKLARKNLVVYEKYRGVVLTDEGLLVGRFLLERHLLLTRLLEVIGLQDASEKMVEGIEHFINAENLRRVKYFLEMAEQYPGVFAGSRAE